MRLYTTFALAKEAGACADSYRTQAKRLGGIKAYGKDTPIYLDDLARESLSDALWCLQAVPATQATERDRLARLLAADYAEHVLPLFEVLDHPMQAQLRQAIALARRYTNGKANANVTAYAPLSLAEFTAHAAAAAAAYVAADAAADAVADAVADAAYAAEREWQRERFIQVLANG